MIRGQELVIIRPPGDGAPISNLDMRVKLSTGDTGGLSSVIEVAHPENAGPPLHVHHRHDEILYVLEGEYRVRIGNAVAAAPAGTVAYARRGTPHTYTRMGRRPGRLLIVVTPGGLEEYMAELDQLVQEGASDDAIACLNRAWATDVLGPGLSAVPAQDTDA
jgi:mannose-6-phosphate isomerase-like protein (cupin superfamily)